MMLYLIPIAVAITAWCAPHTTVESVLFTWYATFNTVFFVVAQFIAKYGNVEGYSDDWNGCLVGYISLNLLPIFMHIGVILYIIERYYRYSFNTLNARSFR